MKKIAIFFKNSQSKRCLRGCSWGKLAPLHGLARLGEVIFIRIHMEFSISLQKACCVTVKRLFWSRGFYIFNMDFRRLQQFHFTVYSIMNMITAFSILLQLHGILLSFTYIRFYLSGSTRRNHFEIEFGKNSKNMHAL